MKEEGVKLLYWITCTYRMNVASVCTCFVTVIVCYNVTHLPLLSRKVYLLIYMVFRYYLQMMKYAFKMATLRKEMRLVDWIQW